MRWVNFRHSRGVINSENLGEIPIAPAVHKPIAPAAGELYKLPVNPMFLTLFRRELLANLMTLRFFVVVVTCLILVIASTTVLLQDYKHRLAVYDTAVKTHREDITDAMTYSQLRLYVDRPPSPLSIFNQGLDKRLGNTVHVHHQFVPTLLDAQQHGVDNPFLNLFSGMDLVFIFQVVLSLMALLFAYDAIAGEREAHTLRLMATNPVSRGLILLAKYASAMICLILSLIISVLLALFLITTSGLITVSGEDFLRILGILLASVIYLSTFYLIGLLISTVSRRAATALVFVMFVWVMLVLVYPSLTVATLDRLIGVEEKLKTALSEIEQFWDRYDADERASVEKNSVRAYSYPTRIGHGDHLKFSGGYNKQTLLHHRFWWTYSYDRIDEDKEQFVTNLQSHSQLLESSRIRAAEKTWLVRKRALDQTYGRKTQVVQMAIRLSPAAIYDLVTEALAGTDLRGIERFAESSRRYRRALIEHLRERKAFSSRQWFSHDKGKVRWDDLPQFSYQRADLGSDIIDVVPDLILLLSINLAIFLAVFLIFRRQAI